MLNVQGLQQLVKEQLIYLLLLIKHGHHMQQVLLLMDLLQEQLVEILLEV